MLPPVTEPRSAKQIDFLSERRKEREQAFKNYLTTSDAKNKPKDIDNEIKYKILVLDENKTLRQQDDYILTNQKVSDLMIQQVKTKLKTFNELVN